MSVVKVSSTQVEQSKNVNQRFWKEVRGYIEALIVAFFIVTFVFTTVGVVGSSMRPNLNGGEDGDFLDSLLSGDRVFIPKYDNWLRRLGILGTYARGDIVVVREPANSPSAQESWRRMFFIKRVMGIPGDRVRIESGQVYINDVALNQDFITHNNEMIPAPVDFPVVVQKKGQVTAMVFEYLKSSSGEPMLELPSSSYYPEPALLDDPSIQFYYKTLLNSFALIPTDTPENEPFVLNFIVPSGHYFVMGDNREVGGSEDSRYFGPIPLWSIAGKASAVIWPPRRNGDWNWRSLTPPEAFKDIPNL